MIDFQKECEELFENYGHESFTFGSLDNRREELGLRKYSNSERILLVSCLQRDFGLQRKYFKGSQGVVTIFSIPVKKTLWV